MWDDEIPKTASELFQEQFCSAIKCCEGSPNYAEIRKWANRCLSLYSTGCSEGIEAAGHMKSVVDLYENDAEKLKQWAENFRSKQERKDKNEN